MIDLEKIKRLAGEMQVALYRFSEDWFTPEEISEETKFSSQAATFIAAANPAAVLEMIAEIKRLQAQLAEATKPQGEPVAWATPMGDLTNDPQRVEFWKRQGWEVIALAPVQADRPSDQVQAEPVAWLFTNIQSGYSFADTDHDHLTDQEVWHKQPLYTAPAASPVSLETPRRLLEALKGLINLTDHKVDMRDEAKFARQAIAEAEGGVA